MIAKFEFKKL